MLVFSNVFILATESESHCKHSLIFLLLAWEREKEALQESRQVSEVAATEFWTYQSSSLSSAGVFFFWWINGHNKHPRIRV